MRGVKKRKASKERYLSWITNKKVDKYLSFCLENNIFAKLKSGSLKWQNKVEYRSLLVSLSLPPFINEQHNLLII